MVAAGPPARRPDRTLTADGRPRRLSPHVLQLDEQAAVLHDVDAGAGQPLGGRVVPDPRLEPDRRRPRGQDVVHVRGDVLRPRENIYNAELDKTTNQPKLTSQFRLFKDGKLLVEGKEKPVEFENQSDISRIQDYGFLRLNENAEAGEYILQLIIKDTLHQENISMD